MMAKRTLWQWMFGLMAKPEPRQPMAVPNNTARKQLTEDEWNEVCNGGAQVIINPTGQKLPDDYELRDLAKHHAGGMHGQGNPARSEQAYTWRPGIEHTKPHPVKENPDGTLYYKGKVYRMIGDHGRRNNKRR